MLFQKEKKPPMVGKHFTLSDKDKATTLISINKIIGQLETIKRDVSTDNACDDSLVQIMAIKGGVQSLGRNLIGKGILDCMDNYSREEMEMIIKNLFKLD
jgi:DNA-binding FrmR family transcriptional regulator